MMKNKQKYYYKYQNTQHNRKNRDVSDKYDAVQMLPFNSYVLETKTCNQMLEIVINQFAF